MPAASTDYIDVLHQGTPGAIAAFHGPDWLLDPGPESCHQTLLAGLPDGFEPRRILLTHIHFDHAGATGRLLERWPEAEVWVHERGAPHMVDPERLVSSARRLYGEKFDTLWGEVVPIAEDRIRVLRGGERIDGWRVEYTPGHASHHVCFLHEDSGTAFCGDVAGVRIGRGPALPPTPPPDIDVELWQTSIQTVRAWQPSELAITHFGTFDDVGAQLDQVSSNLARLAQFARETDLEGFAARIRELIDEQSPDEQTRASYARANPPDTLFPGLDRYWTKKAEKEGASDAAAG
jgi:glyoxylase-like metal-dependent hydrolase (beta-lactamase superfamily II)